MSKTTQSIIDMVGSQPAVDNQDTFDQLWSILGDLFAKVDARFELHADPSTEILQPYHGLADSGGAEGFLSTFAGPEIDWLVHSWVGNPKLSFTNMHLTISLGAQYDAPNLGLAFGTTPDLFFYMDYVPRKELLTNPEYMDQYYIEANQNFLTLQQESDMVSFISQDVYTRVAQTATSLCISAPNSTTNMDKITHHAHEMLDRWLGWLDKPAASPESEWEARAERDEFIRRTIADRDPVNPLVAKLFGDETANNAIRALWGGDRHLPRAHRWK
ncbi:MAG: hypothetical protein V7711_08990 [Pseudomonadales bacterium]